MAGGLLAAGGTERLNLWCWTALFGVAGLFHGYACGESIFGAEATPLSAYLLGLVIVQTALATAVASLIRQKGAAMLGAAPHRRRDRGHRPCDAGRPDHAGVTALSTSPRVTGSMTAVICPAACFPQPPEML